MIALTATMVMTVIRDTVQGTLATQDTEDTPGARVTEATPATLVTAVMLQIQDTAGTRAAMADMVVTPVVVASTPTMATTTHRTRALTT